MKISGKIEKDTHRAILMLLFKRSNNAAYLNILENFSVFMSINNMTYISACLYFINEFNSQ
jgi:hypothetical protein